MAYAFEWEFLLRSTDIILDNGNRRVDFLYNMWYSMYYSASIVIYICYRVIQALDPFSLVL